MYKYGLKRVIDFILVFIVLVVIWPILLLITIWLHFANKGAGAFFTQERPGKDGRIFRVIKFKSMTDERDAEGKLLPDANDGYGTAADDVFDVRHHTHYYLYQLKAHFEGRNGNRQIQHAYDLCYDDTYVCHNDSYDIGTVCYVESRRGTYSRGH